MRDIYVDSTKGDDTHDGLDPTKPRRSIPYMTLQPGDLVHVEKGKYRGHLAIAPFGETPFDTITPLPPAADEPSSPTP